MSSSAPAVTYRLTRSRRRRRTIEISINPSGELAVAAPVRASQAEIDSFVISRRRWIEKSLRQAQQHDRLLHRELASGECLPYLDRTLLLDVVERDGVGPSVELESERLVVNIGAGADRSDRRAIITVAIESWYHERAEEIISERVAVIAERIGVRPKRVVVREQKTRWGSCGKDGTLYFNWHLIMAPLTVVDYLVVHELCHLQQAGHGVKFWTLVERVLPDYKSQRKQLRIDGWRYRLGAG